MRDIWEEKQGEDFTRTNDVRQQTPLRGGHILVKLKTMQVISANNSTKNKLQASDETIHGWYRFVLGYPPHLVREYLNAFGADPHKDSVFDPFCGTATTPVEARLQGFSTVSIDANPIAVMAAKVKLNWDMDTTAIQSNLEDILEIAARTLKSEQLKPFPDGDYQPTLFSPKTLQEKNAIYDLAGSFAAEQLLTSKASVLIPKGFISPKPLLRVLSLRHAIINLVKAQEHREFFYLALANTIVRVAGNVAFGPEVYQTPPKDDADVLGAYVVTLTRMVSDLKIIQSRQRKPFPPAYVNDDDARSLTTLGNKTPIGVVITSPPYPNEKDYTRSTRLESVLLGLISSREDLRKLKSRLLRSNTRNVFVNDDDDKFIADIPSILRVAEEIENKRITLGKTSGFERLYHRVTRLYFGGMYRHFIALLPKLRPGGYCAYVVGDQMSYFRVQIRTAQLLADVAINAGFKVDGIKLWRTRRSTTTGVDLEENVLILKRPNEAGGKHYAKTNS